MSGALSIERAAHDGRGIARDDGKVVFVSGALPGERVTVGPRRRRRGIEEAEVADVLESSPGRVAPRCAHFGTCGGCAMQHADTGTQVRIKQRALADALERIGRVFPERWLEPVTGPAWGYRRRARLSVRFVTRKGRVLIGFRERGNTPLVADLSTCDVLAPPVGAMIAPLARMVGSLQCARAIPQIEVAVSTTTAVLVIRHMAPLEDRDRLILRGFAAEHGVEFHLQPGGRDSIEPLDPPATPLAYTLPEFGLELGFGPADFVQVNEAVNRALVARAVELMDAGPKDSVLDLFCGLGNFSLPLARTAGRVTGVEGDDALVARARENADRNGIENAEFHTADLIETVAGADWDRRGYDHVLLDPPRAGARVMIERVPAWAPRRVVYVSCHPGTLARDADALVNRQGYRLAAAGVVDMFPHTAHVESIAVFERGAT